MISLLMTLACQPKVAEPAAEADRRLMIAAQGNMDGDIEPCG
jgi:hypothetical protein